MITTYHLNPATGDVNPCSASIQKCIFGETNHYTTEESAYEAFEGTRSASIFPRVKKQLTGGELLAHVKRVNNTLERLTNSAARYDSDSCPIAGLREWATLSVHAESDLTLTVVRFASGEVRAARCYGPQDLTIMSQGFSQVFTKDKFIELIDESEDFDSECRDFECDKWLETGCLEHSDYANGSKAWNAIYRELFSRFG